MKEKKPLWLGSPFCRTASQLNSVDTGFYGVEAAAEAGRPAPLTALVLSHCLLPSMPTGPQWRPGAFAHLVVVVLVAHAVHVLVLGDHALAPLRLALRFAVSRFSRFLGFGRCVPRQGRGLVWAHGAGGNMLGAFG
jgi:hypothetical protein